MNGSASSRVALCILISAAILLGAVPTVSAKPDQAIESPGQAFPPSVKHVITIVMENEEYSQVIGNPSAAYENSLARNYSLLSSYYAVGHPSLPNYFAIVAGDARVSSDCLPSQCTTNASSIVDLLRGQGLSWKEYAESMPTNCSQTASADRLYQPKHDPFVYFSGITGNDGSGQTSAYCDAHVVPFDQFLTDLRSNAIPGYSFITPNMCHDGHDCGLSAADSWLSSVVPAIESSKEFDSTVLFIVYDEGAADSGFGSAHGGQVLCVVVSPLVNRGYNSAVQYSHYSLLATTESLLGLGSLGRNDSTARQIYDVFAVSQTTENPTGASMTSSFGPNMSTILAGSNTASDGSRQGPESSGLYLIASLLTGLSIATVIVLVVPRRGRLGRNHPEEDRR